MRRTALDYTGDPYPGETNQIAVDAPPEHDWNPAEEYKFFYGNGQFHISEEHDHDELAGHAGVPSDHTGPMAVGHVHVDMGKATFDVMSNIGAQPIARVLKDYCKQVGWAWGGMTDQTGEPIGTGSEFAPVKSYYFALNNGQTRIAHKRTSIQDPDGAVHIDGKVGRVYGSIFPGLEEWAEDQGYKLAAPQFDQMQEHVMQSWPGRSLPKEECYEVADAVERRWPKLKQDSGFYVRPRAGAGDHAWNIAPDGTIYDMTAKQFGGVPHIIPPDHPHYKRYVSWTRHESEAQIHAHDQGYHYEGAENPEVCPKCRSDRTAGNDNVMKRIEDMEENNNYTPEWNNEDEHFMFQNEPDERQPGGVFKCRDCGRLFHDWGVYMQHRNQEEPPGDYGPDQTKQTEGLDMDAPIPAGWHDQPSFTEARRAKVFQSAPGSLEGNASLPTPTVSVVPENQGQNDWDDFGWRIPVIYDQKNNVVGIGQHGDYHYDVSQHLGYNHLGHGRGLDEGWISVKPHPEALDTDRPPGFHMRPKGGGAYPLEEAQHIQQALISHYPEAAQYIDDPHGGGSEDEDLWMTGAVSPPEGKDMITAPVPFIYDIDNDQITVGRQGSRHSDIPGKFTPGGIVEGTYEPGGKVEIRSMTNMPYTVRHMLEVWYYQHPAMEIRSVHLVDDADKRTKLAASGQDIGGYIMSLIGADPVAWRASKALKGAGGKVYVVGGAVRDALKGKSPKDLDLMVTGVPEEEVRRALGTLKGKVDLTGKDFGIFRYKEGDHDVEIALPRRERSTGPGHKDQLTEADHTMTPQEDLFRRDFTVNAMAVDLDNGHLIDPFGGAKDVKDGRLRTLNTRSLADDPLRTVRALVAHARHGFYPDDDTKAQMGENAAGIQHLPGERIKEEMDKLLKADNPASAIRLAHETGVLKYLMPDVDRTFGWSQDNPHHEQELGEHLLSVLEGVKKRKPEDIDLALAGLRHDTGKYSSRWDECKNCPRTDEHEPVVIPNPGMSCPNCGNKGSGHFYKHIDAQGKQWGANHEDVGAKENEEWMRKQRYSEDRIKRVTHLIQHHMFPAFDTPRGARKFLAKVGDQHADDLLHLRWADQGGKSVYPTDPSLSVDRHQELVNEARQANAPTQLSQLAITGRDLIGSGMKPGPEMGTTLNRLVEQVVENPELNTREGLLGLVRGWGLIQ